MALVLRGKDKDKYVKIMQFCNDWVSAKNEPKIYNITALKFTKEEFNNILHHDNLGMMLNCFKPDFETRIFKKRKT